jgi:hypothetical protein
MLLKHTSILCGVAWRGVAWRGVAWRGVAWRGVAWRGVAWRGVAFAEQRIGSKSLQKATFDFHTTSIPPKVTSDG